MVKNKLKMIQDALKKVVEGRDLTEAEAIESINFPSCQYKPRAGQRCDTASLLAWH